MSKKEEERPRFRCPQCGAIWVYHEPICIICKSRGTPLNKRAERLLKNKSIENGVQINDR